MPDDPHPPDAGQPHPGTGLHDALLAIGALMGLLVFVELAVPSMSAVTAASVLDAVAVAAFTVTGLIAWRRRPHNRTGRLMVATAAALLVAGMSDDEVPTLRVLGEVTESLPLAVLIHLLLAFPSGRLDGPAARVTAAAGYGIALGLQYPQQLVSPEASTVLWNVQAGLGLIALISAFVLVSRRLAAAHVDTAGAVELLAGGADGIGYLLKRRAMNLDLPPNPEEHRRVLAMMRYLNGGA
jgi:hypothetical protein